MFLLCGLPRTWAKCGRMFAFTIAWVAAAVPDTMLPIVLIKG
jgi:hypothetical protein